MKDHLHGLISDAITQLRNEAVLPEEAEINVQIERTRDALHGDFATNAAMMMAKHARRKPRDRAEMII